MKACGQAEWSFHNVIPNVADSINISDVDVEQLWNAVKDKEKVIALGNIVSRVCQKHGIDHFRCDHPSPRNRNLNDPGYESIMLHFLVKYLHEH